MQTITNQSTARRRRQSALASVAFSVLFFAAANGADQSLEQYYEPNRCGPIALFCVCKSYKIETTIDELAHLAGFDGRETSVAGLVAAAEAKGLKAEPFESSMAHLTTLGGPAIIDYPKGHFCAFYGWKGTSAVILDPPKKTELVSFNQLRRDWGRHVITFSIDDTKRKPTSSPARAMPAEKPIKP